MSVERLRKTPLYEGSGEGSDLPEWAADRIEELELALDGIWKQLAPGVASIPDVPVARVNIGAIIMRALPNKPEKADRK